MALGCQLSTIGSADPDSSPVTDSQQPHVSCLRFPLMGDWARISIMAHDGFRRFSRASGAARSQPGWVTRTAIAVVAAVVLLPLLALALAAVTAGVVVFVALAAVSAVLQRWRGLAPRRDGRENVRVVQPRQHI